MSEIKSDPALIKNPFICNSSAGIRLSLDKDPRVFREGEQLLHKIELENGNTLLHNPTDDRLSFMFGDKENKNNLVDLDNVDYQVPAEVLNKTSKVKHKEGLPLSFLQIETEEEGIEWYARHFPKLPTDLLPLIARYHFGETITKKGLKNEKKKIIKKAQKKGISLEKRTAVDNNNNPFILDFD
tara:strand:+ start:4497 stop:5048 length:552 start_codon:yes stop_codon:yes gene_type:complete